MRAFLRPTLSTILVFFFAFVLLFLGLFAEVFESRAPEIDLAQIYANPIPILEIQHLKTLRITNKQGSFLLENTHPGGLLIGPWQMLEPQALRVRDDVVQKIVDALNVIRVRNFHRLEPINVISFSLDNPTLTLNFGTTAKKAYEIKMGLINPIDNSAYMGLSSQNQIYQIDPIEMALETYDLAQLVESKVLAIGRDSLVSLEIYGQKGLEVKLLKKETSWVDQNGMELSTPKVLKFLERLEELKSFSILETLTNEQKAHMDKIMSTPTFSLKIISTQGVRTYVVGEVKDPIPEMPIDKNGYYALSPEERNSFVLLEKDQVRVFSLKSQELK